MTPKEKAKELIDKCKWINYNLDNIENHKEGALIAVNEILENFGTLTEGKDHYCAYLTTKYYEEVKQEIEKL